MEDFIYTSSKCCFEQNVACKSEKKDKFAFKYN